jgi:hypothetical protein
MLTKCLTMWAVYVNFTVQTSWHSCMNEHVLMKVVQVIFMLFNRGRSFLCLDHPWFVFHAFLLFHEDVCGSGCIDPHFLDLCTSCRWVAELLYFRGKSPRYPLDRRLGGPQRHNMERWKFLPPPGLELWPLGRPVCTKCTIPALLLLHYY